MQDTEEIQTIINLLLADKFTEANKQLQIHLSKSTALSKGTLENQKAIKHHAELLSIWNVNEMNQVSIKINTIPVIEEYDS